MMMMIKHIATLPGKVFGTFLTRVGFWATMQTVSCVFDSSASSFLVTGNQTGLQVKLT